MEQIHIYKKRSVLLVAVQRMCTQFLTSSTWKLVTVTYNEKNQACIGYRVCCC